jgi:MYXO-CTERM domain-containing protein
MQAQGDLTTAYNAAAGLACGAGNDLSGQDLGGSAQLTGTLTLNGLGDPSAFFLFQIGKTLTTASASSVIFTNGGGGDDLFWQVGSSATLGTTTVFEGSILALASITLDTGANIECGRALASTGAVTMDTNLVSIGSAGCAASAGTAPEPATSTMLGLGLLVLAAGCVMRRYSVA